MVKKIIIIINVSTQGAKTKRKVNKMKTNETLYTLTAFFRDEFISSSDVTYRTHTYQFTSLSGLHSAMECAMNTAKDLTNQYSKERVYNMHVRRTVIFR